MRYFIKLLTVVLVMFIGSGSYALNFKQANTVYTQAALQRAKYYPQNQYAYRYRRQNNNYIYSPQQARYYGYRIPQQTGTYNPSYRRY